MDTNRELRILSGKISSLRQKGYIPSGLVDLAAQAHEIFVKATVKARVEVPHPGQLPPADQRSQGAPLVPRESFPHDTEQAEELFAQHIELLHTQNEALVRAAEILGQHVADKELVPAQAFEAHLLNNQAFFNTWAATTPDTPKALSFVTQCALAPSIARAARDLVQHLPKDNIWQHGHCPVCGSMPHMAELRDQEGFRYLSCSFCRHSYRVKRIACPFCDETDFDKLSFFTSKDEPGYRIDVCSSCNMYVKTIDFRQLDRVPLPVMDDLDSLVLDVLAMNKGFTRPTPSCWGF